MAAELKQTLTKRSSIPQHNHWNTLLHSPENSCQQQCKMNQLQTTVFAAFP
ncbi:hypothetical protein Bca4012_018620 [Brassica carinata]